MNFTKAERIREMKKKVAKKVDLCICLLIGFGLRNFRGKQQTHKKKQHIGGQVKGYKAKIIVDSNATPVIHEGLQSSKNLQIRETSPLFKQYLTFLSPYQVSLMLLGLFFVTLTTQCVMLNMNSCMAKN